ncbi:uncharacterized protein P884DRAFT_28721 [Thermothelomyces heterothallicus CBS 202.75]|uniref:uncharacterized protein n=1 Tax=Thermothelomyces heterothallicus CBS 202.75 TaxID=1149848 RepID=UPI0037449772
MPRGSRNWIPTSCAVILTLLLPAPRIVNGSALGCTSPRQLLRLGLGRSRQPLRRSRVSIEVNMICQPRDCHAGDGIAFHSGLGKTASIGRTIAMHPDA